MLVVNLFVCVESFSLKSAIEINVKVSSIEIEVEDLNDLECFMCVK